jgi:hypothetical protein
MVSEAEPTPHLGDAEVPASGGEGPTGSTVDDPARRVQYVTELVDAAARDLLTVRGVDDTLDMIVKGALRAVPGATEAGISLVHRRGRIVTFAPSSAKVAELDELQAGLGEGPCIDSICDETQVSVPDLATEHARWPRFVPAALGRRMQAMLAFQLFADPGSAGALNLYASVPHAFGQLSHEVGALYASHAAIALAGAQQADHLTEAVASRDLIGRAKGVLMQRHHISEDEAFQLLARSSNDLRIKLTDLAARISGEAATDSAPTL